jgi:hypothetical protein
MSTALPPALLFPGGSGFATSRLMLVADISNYTGNIGDAGVIALEAAGVAHVIVRISLEDAAREAITVEQLSALRARNVAVSGYIFPDYSRVPADYLAEVFNLAGEIRSLWLDLEPPGMPRFAAFHDWAIGARAASRVPVGIYTAAWCVAQIPDWGDISDFPLWAADHGPFKGLAVDFGGWTRAAGVQCAGSIPIGKVLCDLSWFDPVALG